MSEFLISKETTISIKRQVPNKTLPRVSKKTITRSPWQILKQLFCQNGPYTSEDLLCFEEWMNETKMYKEELITEVKSEMTRTYGQGMGTSFSKDFS
jgi:hypothetical protein